MKLTTVAMALTSLSPAEDTWDRQWACVESWRRAGCKVLAFQTAAEIERFRLFPGWPGVEFVPVDDAEPWSGKYVAISSFAQWARAYAAIPGALPILIINADCELECQPEMLETLAREAGEGLCYLVRHETDGTRCAFGVDAFLMAAESAALIPRSDVLVMGRCHWDYVVPCAFLDAKRPVCSPAFRIMSHETHPSRQVHADVVKTQAEARRILGYVPSYGHFANRTRYLDRDMRTTHMAAHVTPVEQAKQEETAAVLRTFYSM